MPSTTSPIAGVRDALVPVLSATPFGLLFGTLAYDKGMTLFEAVLMSATIFGGASQMVGIELFKGGVAAWLIVFSIFAVNFRHILYSASVGRHFSEFSFLQKALSFFLLVDPLYAASELRVERKMPLTFAWYAAYGLFMYVVWVAGTVVGYEFGRLISNPEALGIDFLLPIYFLGLLLGFRKRQNWLPVVLASGVGSIIAYLTVGSPWHVGLGSMAGILVAVLMPLDHEVPMDPVPQSDGPEDMG
ncbi:branched-chain amino acid ABC transporter permease [Pseudohoeflea suaedae]|uniref:Branched-chain amino acid ABC transporter permease n=1 Tax=Pseudohoeflea suaedae TaxID=877384 RepID=A0A4R5PH76_9HYPH|nr:AzlC family ABC transporter permease [Pseudohoeflea suaedae]TDH34238.1 branched-chain amino acid ABC transporter permease [Pseudohoeflea suaedae]